MEIKKHLTSRNFTKGKDKKNLFIVIHYTANNGDTALNNCTYFQRQYRGASANYFVDENWIYQCVRDEDIAWHCGALIYYNDCRNNNSIGIELCSRKDNKGNYYFKEDTINNAVELTCYLMQKYDIDIKHVVRHYDVTHKCCPAPFVHNYSAWEDFLDRVETKLKGEAMEEEKTLAEKEEIIKQYYNLDDNTIRYFEFYRYNIALIDKLYYKAKNG